MIFLTSVSKQYGEKILFSDFSFQINDGARIALVGPNGAGKSTLLKIITGDIEPDGGSIHRSRHATVGYLPQDGIYHRGESLMEEASKAFEVLLQLEERIVDLTGHIEELTAHGGPEPPELSALLDELGQAQHAVEQGEVYRKDSKIQEILFGLGFAEKDLHRPTEEFSGGWHMRIELAKLLLRQPSTLLLDEPTNHLDMESLEWLESYLQGYQGSIVVVSHDSRFLDNLVTQVVEITLGKAREYRGNYSAYLVQKEERNKIAEASFANQQKLIERTTRFVERFRYKNTKAKQAQSRLKMLDKLETVEIEGNEQQIGFSFPDPPRSGRIVMELKHLHKSYGDEPLLRDLSLTIESGDHIACLGVNGSGKSTLARIMAGIEAFQAGERVVGHNVSIAYYSQNRTELLHPHKTVLATLEEQAPGRSPTELRTLLGSFLFSGDDAFKPVSVLSGGEKSRLALAKMLLEPANFLILDEPTNHLDVTSKAVLQRRLLDFRGTCFIVSHDRDFLVPLVNKVVSLGGGEPEIFGGTLEEYLERMHRLREEAAEQTRTTEKKSDPSAERQRKQQEALARQEKHRKLKPLVAELKKVEAAIEEREQRRQTIEKAFSNPETFADEQLLRSLQKEHAELRSELDPLYEEWEERQEAVESISGERAAP